MNPKGRPRDLIERIEAIAAEHGHFEPVDENYYQAFVELNQPQIEKLAIVLMLDQEKEVRRLRRRGEPFKVHPEYVRRGLWFC